MTRRSAPAHGAVLLACLVGPGPAGAAPDQEMLLQDDPRIVYARSAQELDGTLAQIKSLGVDRIRVHLTWHLVAPSPTSERRPRFTHGPRHPASYPAEAWERYDRIMKLAQRHGLGVLLTVVGPAPAWASARPAGEEGVTRPRASDFRDFVTAVGYRYSGSYPDGQPRPEQQGSPMDGQLPPPVGQEPEPPPPASQLPRADHWSIWNEPNFPSWLLPQWRPGGRYRPVSPHLYRRLVDAAWAGLVESGHGGDLLLLGETAPFGPKNRRRPKGGAAGLMSPVVFVRELYCLDRRYRPFRGEAAAVRGCPETAEERARFALDHPGLFSAAGWAHHPYSLRKPPTYAPRPRHSVTLGALGRLTRALDAAQLRWGAQGEAQLWITEYGYQTLPPDPYRGVSWRRQALWMSWAEHIAFRNPRVKAFAQFLLADDAPRRQFGSRDQRRWDTWQSGLLTTDGTEKPAYRELRLPLHVEPTRFRPARGVRVFGAYRPAADGTPLAARIDFRRTGEPWQPLRSVAAGPRGYVSATVHPRAGFVRILWQGPGILARSRAVRVAPR